mmetsp:Transcript_21335/g.3464  ORF Transcript_21335/g.3464 Transcript_21335/m.3464 type:complete len:95 (-) Transcript_21335:625-909(-)
MHRVYEEEEEIVLVLDYLEGGDLYKKIIRTKRLTEIEAVKFARNMCKALQYLSQNEIIHRDLKLENIMILKRNCNYKFKISDFGLSTKIYQNEN